MDYFQPAIRELTRKLRRQLTRRRVALRRHDLARAETELGLLGWQQADYDAETQRQVQEIQNVEREQSQIANDAANLSMEISRLQDEQAAARRQYEDARRPLEAERRRLREPYEAAQRQLSEKRKSEPNFQSRIPELDRELREVKVQYSALLAMQPETTQIRLELQRLRGRTVAIPNEKAELRTQHFRITTEIHELEESLARDGETLAALDAQLKRLEGEWKQHDEKFTALLGRTQGEKAKIEKHIDDLEGAKANPYQRIGQVLADNNLAPINQPQALETVKQLRFAVGELEQTILESETLTAQEDPDALQRSFLALAAVGAAVILLLVMVIAW